MRVKLNRKLLLRFISKCTPDRMQDFHRKEGPEVEDFLYEISSATFVEEYRRIETTRVTMDSVCPDGNDLFVRRFSRIRKWDFCVINGLVLKGRKEAPPSIRMGTGLGLFKIYSLAFLCKFNPPPHLHPRILSLNRFKCFSNGSKS